MIISSAPLRISFCGGGTDYKNFFQEYGGGVIGTAINQRVYVFVNSLSKFSDENIRFTYRITESVQEIDSINHPVVRAALKELNIFEKINIATMSDVPGNSGLGSSSAFTVALVGGLARFKNMFLTNEEIVHLAYKIERDILLEAGGVQDYLHATYGSLRHYCISKNGNVKSQELISPSLQTVLENRVALIRYGESRYSSQYAQITDQASSKESGLLALKQNLEITERVLSDFNHTSDAKALFLSVADSVSKNWALKKIFQSDGIPEDIEDTEKKLRDFGLISMKLCGAGKSGYLLAFFAEDIPRELIGEENILDFKLELNGLVVQEL